MKILFWMICVVYTFNHKCLYKREPEGGRFNDRRSAGDVKDVKLLGLRMREMAMEQGMQEIQL